MEFKAKNERANSFHVSIFYHIVTSILVPATFMVLPLLNKKALQIYDNEKSLFCLFMAGIIGGILVNIGIYKHNHSKKIITSILFNDVDQLLRINYQKMYSAYRFTDQLPYSKLHIDIEKKEVLPIALQDNKIVLRNEEEYFGEISLGGTYWNKEGGKINAIKKRLSEIVQKNYNQ